MAVEGTIVSDFNVATDVTAVDVSRVGAADVLGVV
jgi:hypothetical protein